MKALRLDISQVLGSFVAEDELTFIQPQISLAHQQFIERSGPGQEFLGWADWPEVYDKNELAQVKIAAEKIQADSDVLVVVGIGGSYLGARAAINFLNHTFYNELTPEKRKTPQIVYAGQNLSGTYLNDLLDWLEDKDFSVNVISKSGTTIETAVAFRVLKEKLFEKYGEEASQRIYATTDAKTGALRQESDEKGYQTFTIPGNIGGRFTVLTPVGLLPMAVSGVDIDEVLEGARQARAQLTSDSLEENEAYLYAAIRNILYRKGFNIELLVYYEPSLSYLAEWWKQLFGESEGKDQMGIYPSSAQFTTDLHSLGQFIQDGSKVLFESVLAIEETRGEVLVPYDEENLDGLNYLAGQPMEEINDKARQGTLRAHVEGNVPNLQLFLKDTSEYSLGYLFYFFELAVTNSAYLNAVNPFDQPGVEAYKKEMFALLGKPDEAQ